MKALKEKLGVDNNMYFDPDTKGRMYGDFLRGICDSRTPRWLIILFSFFAFILPFLLFSLNLWFILNKPTRTPEEIFNSFGFFFLYLLFAIVGVKLIFLKK